MLNRTQTEIEHLEEASIHQHLKIKPLPAMDSDLTTQDGVRSYLTQHLSLDVDPNGVSRLGGGYCNFAWRVKLNAPYQGHESIILKHAQAHLSSDQTVEIGVERLVCDIPSSSHRSREML